MFDIGWSELLLVAVVAIIVVGPRDLPRALRTLGQWAARVRGVAREFQKSVDDMIRDSELEELRRETQSLTNLDLDEAPLARIEPAQSGEGGFRPPPEADEEADEARKVEGDEAYKVAGAVAPAHSLAGPREAQAAPGDNDEASTTAEGERTSEQAPTGANG